MREAGRTSGREACLKVASAQAVGCSPLVLLSHCPHTQVAWSAAPPVVLLPLPPSLAHRSITSMPRIGTAAGLPPRACIAHQQVLVRKPAFFSLSAVPISSI